MKGGQNKEENSQIFDSNVWECGVREAVRKKGNTEHLEVTVLRGT
jgi:hypothetical protein